MTFAVRNYRRSGQVLLAACDQELLGTKHEEGPLRLDVRGDFYDGLRVDEGELRQFLGACTVANLVGERTVAVAVAMGVVESRNVRRVGGVPHAQMMVL